MSGVYVRLGADGKTVKLLFTRDPEGSKPANISQWVLDPKECLVISEAMATAAFEADTTMKPVGPALKASIIEGHRMKLTQRVAIMLGSLRGDKLKTDGRVAQDIIEVCLKEIFS